jgi:hypothetical protein
VKIVEQTAGTFDIDRFRRLGPYQMDQPVQGSGRGGEETINPLPGADDVDESSRTDEQ